MVPYRVVCLGQISLHVLSTACPACFLLHNLSLVKKHTGEVRKASKKGWLTKLFEGIFNI